MCHNSWSRTSDQQPWNDSCESGNTAWYQQVHWNNNNNKKKQYKSYGHWKTQFVSIYQNLWAKFNICKMILFFVLWRIKSWKSTYNRFNFKDSVVISQVKRISPLHASMHRRPRAENTNYFCLLPVGQAAPMTSLCPPVSFLQILRQVSLWLFSVMQLFNYVKTCH